MGGVCSSYSLLKSWRRRAISGASSTVAPRICISESVMSSVSLPDEVRAACAWVAGRARFVRTEEGEIEAYAAGLAAGEADQGPASGTAADPEAAAAFAICMNAINFGSGWWPTIRKRP